MKRLGLWFLVIVFGFGLLAPVLCNDVPVVARVQGQWSFPALATYFGSAPLSPGHGTWKDWWIRLEPGADDFAVMPPWPFSPYETDAAVRAGPSARHWLGQDDTGRDLLARLVHGSSTALWVGLGATCIAMVLGVGLGALAGLRGGLTDQLVLRLLELFLSFPALLFAIAATALLGRSQLSVVIVLGLLLWPNVAQITRGELLSLREREYVHAARGLGVSELRLLLYHLLPRMYGPILVTLALVFASAVVTESTLTFLGLGPSRPSWGEILAQGRNYAVQGAWHLWLFPSLAMLGCVASLYSLGERESLGVRG